uniref:Plasmid stabilization system n=1 Tax=Chlorobium chlorochromatii (strain CaD3) TaxID=340177 RepID=Q3AT27_CHLCH
MATRLIWSPEALEDIELIASYIERDSLWYAKVVASKIFAVAETIAKNPKAGRVVPEIANPCIRERLVYNYRIIYRIDVELILVVAVIHGARLLPSLTHRFEFEQ